MECSIEKYPIPTMKSWKRESADGTGLSTQE